MESHIDDEDATDKASVGEAIQDATDEASVGEAIQDGRLSNATIPMIIILCWCSFLCGRMAAL